MKIESVVKPVPIVNSKDKVKKKKSFSNDEENINDLERVLQSKYGSSAFKAQFIEEEDDDELVIPKKKPVYDKFGGFGSAAGTKKEPKAPLVPIEDDAPEDVEDFPSNWKGITDESTIGSGYSKAQVVNEGVTYRLRKPNEVQSKQLEKDINIIRGITKPADNSKSSRSINNTTNSKEAVKNAFNAFEFGNKKDKSSSQAQLFDTTKTFADLGVSDPIILENLEKMQITNPTNIQVAALSAMLAPGSGGGIGDGGDRREIVMQAQTGSGKTLAFLLPLLRVINPEIGKVQCLIIAPSRELVVQIGLVGTKLFAGSKYRIVPLIGGVNVRNQIKQLRDTKPQVLVSTPGRLAELVFKLEKVRLGMVRALIIDEVDNLLKEPFLEELQTIMEATPLFANTFRNPLNDENVNVQPLESTEALGSSNSSKPMQMVCLASATASNDESVTTFANRYLSSSWRRVSVDEMGTGRMIPRTITHALISSPRIKAFEMLRKCLQSQPAVTCALIFVNDPHRVEVLYEQLIAEGFIAAPLHGDSSKDDRKEILSRLRSGRLRIVVTTELSARGLDIPDLTHVINYELPTNAIHYVHRAGRCGRAGREGLVINFANPNTKFVVRRFGKQLKIKVLDCEIRQGQIFLKDN
eukprot:gene27404-36176_t